MQLGDRKGIQPVKHPASAIPYGILVETSWWTQSIVEYNLSGKTGQLNTNRNSQQNLQ